MTEPSDGDDLLDFEASQRRRRWIGLAIAVLGLALLGAGWLWWRSTGLPPLDPEDEKDVREALDALSTIPPEYHAELAAAAMAELEHERLPPEMVEAFDDAAGVPPDMVDMVLIRPFADDADSLRAWTLACPAGASAVIDYATTGNVDKLFADCELGRWGLIDAGGARRAGAGRLVLAHASWAWLVEHHSETELERRVLRLFVQG